MRNLQCCVGIESTGRSHAYLMQEAHGFSTETFTEKETIRNAHKRKLFVVAITTNHNNSNGSKFLIMSFSPSRVFTLSQTSGTYVRRLRREMKFHAHAQQQIQLHSVCSLSA
jgi:cyclophilin family peptidyl-prolyl cis-trans isomerase